VSLSLLSVLYRCRRRTGRLSGRSVGVSTGGDCVCYFRLGPLHFCTAPPALVLVVIEWWVMVVVVLREGIA